MSDTSKEWRTLRTILESPGTLERPEVVIPRIAWRGRSTLLAAREKDGKSTIVTAGAATVAQGVAFLDGSASEPGTVLWVGVEEHENDLVQRAVRFNANRDRFFVLGMTAEPLGTLRAAVGDIHPKLVVIDTLMTWADRWIEDARSATSWTPVMAAVTSIAREFDAGMVLCHHARKSDGAYRDSSAIGAGVDVIIEMAPYPQDPTARLLKVRARWAMEGFAVRLVGEKRFELVHGSVPVSNRIVRYIEENPGCSHKSLRKGVGGRAIDVDEAVAELIEEGIVRDEGTNGRRRYCLSPSESEGSNDAGTT